MDSTLTAAYIGVVSALGGVILGSAITGIQNWRERSRRRKSVRRILSWEHVYNIDILEKFWKQVNQTQSQDQLDPAKEFERNLRFTEIQLDDWAHQMWQSYSSEVASTLSQDEFNQSYRLHTTLDKFSSRRKAFSAILQGDIGEAGMIAYHKHQQMQSSSPGGYIPQDTAAMHNTNMFLRPLWDECTRLYTTCHQVGNPIQSQRHHWLLSGVLHLK